MRLTVIGCSGTLPGPTAPCSSYLVEHDGFRLLLDSGPGSVGVLQQHVGLLDLDAVFVSHLHPDHWADLVPYSYGRRYHPSGEPPPLPVYGPRGLQERLLAVFDRPPSDRLEKVYEFVAVDGSPLEIGPFHLTFARTNHPIECYAARLSAGRADLVYSADTADCPDLVRLADGADVFLCEASYDDEVEHPPGLHLTGSEAGQHARRADVGHLIVTHVMPWFDAHKQAASARAAYGADVTAASAGLVHEL